MEMPPKIRSFWSWAALSVAFRLALIRLAEHLNFGSRPEIATPHTSLRRLAEGYWLKQSSMSPYAGSMYHGSPLLLFVLGPLTVKRIGEQPNQVLSSLLFVIADFLTAMLIRATAASMQSKFDITRASKTCVIATGDVSALIYLWNPMTIITCLGYSTTPIENMLVVLSLFGAWSGLFPLAAFGWVVASHLSLYPAVLVIRLVLLLGYGPDAPPRKLLSKICGASVIQPSKDGPECNEVKSHLHSFSWRPGLSFLLWAAIWLLYVFGLCAISLKDNGGLIEMFRKTYGFILTVQDLSPNIGTSLHKSLTLLEFSSSLFMILPLAIRLNRRPCFLAFLYIVVFPMLKSYPSVLRVKRQPLYFSLGPSLGFLGTVFRMNLKRFCKVQEMQISTLQQLLLTLACRSFFYWLRVWVLGSMHKHDRMIKKKVLSGASED